MKKIFIVLIGLLFFGNLFAGDTVPSFLKGKYELVMIYGPGEEIRIPLKVIKDKPVVPGLEGDFVYHDGIYCSSDGNYLEGLCRFKDREGEKWELRISAEPSSQKGYSIFTINFSKDQKGIQQIDFAYKGKPGEIMNMGVTPFCVNGMPGITESRFAVCLIAKF